jgi:hypothetical protein
MRKQVTHNRWVKSMDERIADFQYWAKNINPSQIKNLCNLTENIY